jgi:hypothetical protein
VLSPALGCCRRGLPGLRVLFTKIRQRRTTRPRDIAHAQAPFAARWHKVRSACKQRACPRKAFTEQIAQAPAQAWVAGRVRQAAGRAVAAGARRSPLWWPEIRAFHDKQRQRWYQQNEPSDQNTARFAYGFRNLDNQRRRARGACAHRQPQAVMTG